MLVSIRIVRLRGWARGVPALEALEAGPRQREAEQRHAHLGPQHSPQPREAAAAALPLQPEPLEHLVPRGDGVSGKWQVASGKWQVAGGK